MSIGNVIVDVIVLFVLACQVLNFELVSRKSQRYSFQSLESCEAISSVMHFLELRFSLEIEAIVEIQVRNSLVMLKFFVLQVRLCLDFGKKEPSARVELLELLSWLQVMKRNRCLSGSGSSKKGQCLTCSSLESIIFFFIDFIYNPFLVLFRAMIVFLSLDLSGAILSGIFGSVQLYCISSIHPIFLDLLKMGCDFNVYICLSNVLSRLWSFFLRLGPKMALYLLGGVMAELRQWSGILFYYYQGVMLQEGDSIWFLLYNRPDISTYKLFIGYKANGKREMKEWWRNYVVGMAFHLLSLTASFKLHLFTPYIRDRVNSLLKG